MRKKLEIGGGGALQFSNYTPPKPTIPPYPIKNERSLRLYFIVINKIGYLQALAYVHMYFRLPARGFIDNNT